MLVSFPTPLVFLPAFRKPGLLVPPRRLLLLLVLAGGLGLIGEFWLGRLECFCSCSEFRRLYGSPNPVS